MPTVTDIRTQFLEFFKSKDHQVLPSSSLVPANDPTLMFANAGMNQFKNIFTGAEKPSTPRAATSQKCVRAGGKHNDLDNVGYTARHHTFFEMLGNFSFGDYFKEGAISHAWELVTKVYGIKPEKIGVTVYHTDDEAFNLWKKIAGLPESKILRVPTNDNFWAMGDTGPCGPCSEIFYDHGVGNGTWALDATGHDMFDERYVEIWNLVFMQYEQKDKETRVNLPKPSIDTGMGLERISAVLQGVHDNYDIDLFKTLIKSSEEQALQLGAKFTGQTWEETLEISVNRLYPTNSLRVIADHLRSSSFLIADGVLPSNEGRGYVLRRIMRRAMRHAHMLGCRDPLMHKLVPTLVHEMGAAYPELKRAEAVIVETLKAEEEKFKETLERGLKLLEEEKAKLSPPPALRATSPLKGEAAPASPPHAISTSSRATTLAVDTRNASGETSPSRGEVARSAGGGVFPGAAAFKLYDTYGFPLDLTQDILRGENIAVDLDGFNAAMAEQKAKARAAWKGSGQSTTAGLWFDVKEKVGATEFLGYTMETAQGQITALIHDGKEVAELKAGQIGQLIVNQTPFYAESGGQVGDTGLITSTSASARVTDTTKPLDGLFVHDIHLDDGTLRVGDTVRLTVDSERRNRIRANHSATHLLHAVLRNQLGAHITQKGSLVAEAKLRFDVTHPKQITYDELCVIEAEVNRLIWQNSTVGTRLMSQDDAIKAGAMALFGEKYGSEVRVLSMGKIDDSSFVIRHSSEDTANESRMTNHELRPYSLELCGGTHVKHTGDIGLFKILSESAVAAGVRRIEAVTQEGAYQHMVLMESLLRDAASTLKTKPEELAEKVAALQDEKKKLEKQLTEAKKQLAMGGGSASAEPMMETIGAYKLASRILGELDAKSLRDLANAMHQKHTDAVSVLLARNEGKASIIVAVGKDLAGKVDAPTLVKAAVEAVGGKGGGGRPDFAQGGGPDGGKLAEALAAIKAKL